MPEYLSICLVTEIMAGWDGVGWGLGSNFYISNEK